MGSLILNLLLITLDFPFPKSLVLYVCSLAQNIIILIFFNLTGLCMWSSICGASNVQMTVRETTNSPKVGVILRYSSINPFLAEGETEAHVLSCPRSEKYKQKMKTRMREKGAPTSTFFLLLPTISTHSYHISEGQTILPRFSQAALTCLRSILHFYYIIS